VAGLSQLPQKPNKHQFANVHFIFSIDPFKALNNLISNQNLSETTQNPARFFENNILAYSVKAVPDYRMKKNRKPCLLAKISKL